MNHIQMLTPNLETHERRELKVFCLPRQVMLQLQSNCCFAHAMVEKDVESAILALAELHPDRRYRIAKTFIQDHIEYK